MSRQGIEPGGTVGLRPGRARTRRRILWLLVITFLLAAIVTAYRAAGGWLVVEDPLEHADAIVVLSGRLPYRAIEAAQLYSRGFAPEVWLTHPGGMREEMARLGLEYTDE